MGACTRKGAMRQGGGGQCRVACMMSCHGMCRERAERGLQYVQFQHRDGQWYGRRCDLIIRRRLRLQSGGLCHIGIHGQLRRLGRVFRVKCVINASALRWPGHWRAPGEMSR